MKSNDSSTAELGRLTVDSKGGGGVLGQLRTEHMAAVYIQKAESMAIANRLYARYLIVTP